MPLNPVDLGVEYTIQKTLGKEKQCHHLESLDFVAGGCVKVFAKFNNYYVVSVKGTKIGLDESFAKMIVVNIA